MFASFFKKASHLLLYKMGPEIWEMYCFFFFAEATIHNSQ